MDEDYSPSTVLCDVRLRRGSNSFRAQRKAWMARAGPLTKSVLAFVDQGALGDPRHHAAKPLADLFHLVIVAFRAHRLERGLVDAVLQHPVLDEFAGLDVVEDLSHRLAARLAHHARA